MKIAFGVEYQGSTYSGWQFQGHSDRTIQNHVQQAFGFVANHDIHVFASGRTDAGVHALQQVCHFETSASRSGFSWRQGANTRLPSDIRIKWVRLVHDDFHVRFKALYRDYIYIIHQTEVPSALWGQTVTSWREPLSVELMSLAAKTLLGEHDFSAFRAAGCQARHPIRQIHEADVWQVGEFIAFAIRGNAFLHHMVRNLTGSLLLIGAGRQPVSWLETLLEGGDRSVAAPTAPAQGLYFRNTHYADRWQIPANTGTPYGLFDQFQSSWPEGYADVDFGDRL